MKATQSDDEQKWTALRRIRLLLLLLLVHGALSDVTWPRLQFLTTQLSNCIVKQRRLTAVERLTAACRYARFIIFIFYSPSW